MLDDALRVCAEVARGERTSDDAGVAGSDLAPRELFGARERLAESHRRRVEIVALELRQREVREVVLPIERPARTADRRCLSSALFAGHRRDRSEQLFARAVLVILRRANGGAVYEHRRERGPRHASDVSGCVCEAQTLRSLRSASELRPQPLSRLLRRHGAHDEQHLLAVFTDRQDVPDVLIREHLGLLDRVICNHVDHARCGIQRRLWHAGNLELGPPPVREATRAQGVETVVAFGCLDLDVAIRVERHSGRRRSSVERRGHSVAEMSP